MRIRKSFILALLVVASLFTCIFLYQHSLVRFRLGAMRAGLFSYRDHHDGRMSPTLRDLVNYSCGKSDPKTVSEWTGFFYVTNLSESDPRGTPLLIASPHNRGMFFGAVLERCGDIKWFSNGYLDRLSKEPWLAVETQFTNSAALVEFSTRIHILPPEEAGE